MITLPQPEVIITHESDLDGLVSGLLLQRLASHLFGAKVALQAYHYQNWRNREPRETSAWVADFALKRGWTSQAGWWWTIIPTVCSPRKPRWSTT
jgi:hypothetical protein